MAPSVTNNTDLTDAREINFEYLKHVVLKFMSCRESEVKASKLLFGDGGGVVVEFCMASLSAQFCFFPSSFSTDLLSRS